MSNKKVVYVGNFDGVPYSTENDVRKAFEHIGWEVTKIQENETNYQQIMDAVAGANLLLITGTWDDAIPLDKWLDIIHYCAKSGIPSATLHLDTFWGTSRGGRRWWLSPMFHTAYIFTADGDYQDEWVKMGKNHVWLPPGVRHDATNEGKFREEYACDVAFVGSNGVGYHEDVWDYRRELVDALRSMCAKNGWSFKNPGGDQPKIDRNDDMNDFYASAKVTVGDSLCLSKEASRYWSDRVPEATGRGGFLIMPQIDALRDIYPNLAMYPWGDYDSLEEMIRYYLAHDDDRSYERQLSHDVTKFTGTYVNRVKELIKEVGLSE